MLVRHVSLAKHPSVPLAGRCLSRRAESAPGKPPSLGRPQPSAGVSITWLLGFDRGALSPALRAEAATGLVSFSLGRGGGTRRHRGAGSKFRGWSHTGPCRQRSALTARPPGRWRWRDFWMPRPLRLCSVLFFPPRHMQAAACTPWGSCLGLSSPPHLGWTGQGALASPDRGLGSKMEIFSWQPHLLHREANLI